MAVLNAVLEPHAPHAPASYSKRALQPKALHGILSAAFTALLLSALVGLGPLLQAMAVPTDMTGTKLAETPFDSD